jgi:hypothetical protein
MHTRFHLWLPIMGLCLFSWITWSSYETNVHRLQNSRYFWWSSVRLDRDPLKKHPQPPSGRKVGEADEVGWDPEFIWVEPGIPARLLVLIAIPAFLVGSLVVNGLGQLGISQVWSFMIIMPILISGWLFFAGWLMDRWRSKHASRVRHATGV